MYGLRSSDQQRWSEGMSDTKHERAVDARSTIEYCVNNITSGDRGRIDAAADETRGYPCLERCGTCKRKSFLVVDGQLRRGENHRSLLGLLDGGEESE